MSVTVAEVRLEADSAGVEFVNIPAGLRQLRLVVTGRLTGAIVEWVLLRCNGDDSSRYDNQYLTGSDDVVHAEQALASSTILLGSLAPSVTPADTVSSVVTDINNYDSHLHQKAFFSTNCRRRRGGQVLIQVSAGFWRGVEPITRVQLMPGDGAFAAGTVFSLYGMGEA